MTTFAKACAVSSLALMLAACTTQIQIEKDLGPSTHYMCGGTPVAVMTGDDNLARVGIDGRAYAAITSQTIYGMRYENLAAHPVLSFWDKGDTAVLELDGKSFPPCTKVADPNRAAIKNYRAIGNDPAWHLAIHDGQLVFNQGYREKLVNAELPAARINEAGQNFVVRTGAQDTRVTIAHKTCKDTLTLRYYPDQVSVIFQGVELKGCGNELSDTEASAPQQQAQDNMPAIAAAPTQPVTTTQPVLTVCSQQPIPPQQTMTPIKRPARPLTDYTGKTWVASQIDGKPVSTEAKPTLTFNLEGLYVANGGCNQFSGAFHIDDVALTIDPKTVETKKACVGDLGKQEQLFMSILKSSTLIDLRDDTLVISTPHRKTIVLTSVK